MRKKSTIVKTGSPDAQQSRAQQRVTIDTVRLSEISSRLAVLTVEQAELYAEQARIFSGMARESRSVATGRRVARQHVPSLPTVSPTDQAAADHALRQLVARRKERLRG